MKKLLFGLMALLIPIGVFATITSSQEFQLNRMNELAQKVQLGTLIAKTPNVVVGKYSKAVQGGANGDVTLLRDLADSHSSIVIPDNAIVENVYVDVITAMVGASVALKLVNAGDLLAETAEGGLLINTRVQGIPDHATVADYIKLTADKTLKATLHGTASAGKFNVYVEYVLGD